jgi:hypothetical protein
MEFFLPAILSYPFDIGDKVAGILLGDPDP